MVYDITRRSTYNHLNSWLTDAKNLTNPNTVFDSFLATFLGDISNREQERHGSTKRRDL